MGMISPSIASNPTNGSGGKNGQPFSGQQPQPMQPMEFQGKGGSSTNSATSGQPQMGQPAQTDMNNQLVQPQRRFPNTIQPWDNAAIGTQQYQAPPTNYQQPQQNGKVGSLQRRFGGKGV
jgi:hypothetical protein